jgi:hypothetical protein
MRPVVAPDNPKPIPLAELLLAPSGVWASDSSILAVERWPQRINLKGDGEENSSVQFTHNSVSLVDRKLIVIQIPTSTAVNATPALTAGVGEDYSRSVSSMIRASGQLFIKATVRKLSLRLFFECCRGKQQTLLLDQFHRTNTCNSTHIDIRRVLLSSWITLHFQQVEIVSIEVDLLKVIRLHFWISDGVGWLLWNLLRIKMRTFCDTFELQ